MCLRGGVVIRLFMDIHEQLSPVDVGLLCHILPESDLMVTLAIRLLWQLGSALD